jgi:hypothetical protein
MPKGRLVVGINTFGFSFFGVLLGSRPVDFIVVSLYPVEFMSFLTSIQKKEVPIGVFCVEKLEGCFS